MASTQSAPPPYHYDHLHQPSPTNFEDLLQQFSSQSESDTLSSSHSHSGASEGGLDGPTSEYTYPSDLLMYVSAAAGDSGAADRQLAPETAYDQSGQYPPSLASYGGGVYSQGAGTGASPAPGSAFSTASSPGYSYAASGSIASNSPLNFAPPSFDGSSQTLFQYSAAPFADPGQMYASSSTQHDSTQIRPNYDGSANGSIGVGGGYMLPSSSSSSVSPPSSTDPLSPYTSPTLPNFMHNETFARILADAQVQGQLQAHAQAVARVQAHAEQSQQHANQHANQHAVAQAAQQAFNSSYLATLNLLPRNGNLLPVHGMYQPPSSIFGGLPSTSALDGGANQALDEGEHKKRKVVEHQENAPTMARGARAIAASSQRPHKTIGRKSSLESAVVQPSTAMQTSQQSRIAPDTTGFNFSLKPHEGSVVDAVSNVTRSSVELIANAGITSSHDARRVYRDDAAKAPMARRAGPQPIAPQPSAAVAAQMATKARLAERKLPAAKKGEKRKKGEKGHNAVERRYRNNINNAIATLRDIVPALRHLKPLPSMPASRRRASQFTLSTAAQAPTPAGLIDGIPAAKTLSKGTILAKAIEYITFLQGARVDGAEDIELFKSVVMEMVAGGPALIAAYEARRSVREAEREKTREALRKEQEMIDEEDSDDEEDEEADAKLDQVKPEETSEPEMDHDGPSTHYNQQYQPPQEQTLSVSPPNPFPPSPISSSDEHGFSPRVFMTQQSGYRGHAPPRILLGAFMGLSFAGGLGYDWTYNASAEASELVGARAWTSRLVRRGTTTAPLAGPSPALLISSDIANPTLLTGLVFLGVASIVASLLYLLYPLFTRRATKPVVPRLDPHVEDELIDKELPRSFYRQRRRAEALASLAQLNDSASVSPTYVDECKAALKARRELLRLVGAPTYGLIPALAKEALATALRNVTTIRVGSFSTWSESDRLEAAVAWVRIAEIEAALGGAQINYLARAYTFLRLFNLSRSKHWPQTTSSTSRPSVNAVLALHLDSLGQPLSANALWSQAVKADRKKFDMVLDPWTEIAISTDLEQVRSILATTKKSTDFPSPSDTVPLLRVSEARCEAALRETWAVIFVAIVQTHTNLSASARFSTIVDQPRLEETIRHVIRATSDGSPIHSMAKVTRALCTYYTTGSEDAAVMARELVHEARANGPVARLGCAPAFFSLVLGDDFKMDEAQVPTMEVDILASATLSWLNVRRQSDALLAAASNSSSVSDDDDASVTPAVAQVESPVLSPSRRALGSKVFTDPSLIAFCASPVADALKFLRAAGLDAKVE